MALPDAEVLLNRLMVKAKMRHMLVLIKLAELGSMRRAAAAMNMAQPAVTQLVAELEKLLETDLFFRHARGVEPTEAAKDLLPIAQRVLDALRDGAEAVANRVQDQGGVVRVAASPAALGGMLHGAMDAFASRNPDIQVIISETGATPLEGVAEASADLICTRQPAVSPKGWEFKRCMDDALTLACGAAHPLMRARAISMADLGSHKWLLNRIGSVARTRFETLASEHDWPATARCHIIMHIPKLTRDMLETGKYLAILPRSVAMPWFAEGDICELETEITQPLSPLGYLWKGPRAGPATTKFAAHLDRVMAARAA